MAVDAQLGPQIEAIISELVGTGRFKSEADVLREGVRLVQERENRLAALDEAIEEGVSSVRAGRTKPADEVFDRLEAKYRAIAGGEALMRVRLSHEAEADLEVIADFIAESDPARAFDTVVDLRAACSALGENPRRFPLVPPLRPSWCQTSGERSVSRVLRGQRSKRRCPAHRPRRDRLREDAVSRLVIHVETPAPSRR